MLTIFKPKPKNLDQRFDNFSRQLIQAFAQIKTDITEVNSKLENQQGEIEKIGQWISYLHRFGQRVNDSHEKISQKQAKIDEKHQKLHTSHQEFKLKHAEISEKLDKKHRELESQMHHHKSELKNSMNINLDSHKELTKREIEGLKGWVSHVSGNIERQNQKSEGLNIQLRNELDTSKDKWDEGYRAIRGLVSNLKNENSDLKQELASITSTLNNTKDDIVDARNLVKNHIKTSKSETLNQNQVVQPVSHTVQVAAPITTPDPIIQQQMQHPQNSGFERHIMAKVMPNRKGYVLKFIIDLAGENRFSTKEIEEIVVKEKRLCGRTSFYAYLKELKYRGKISSANIDERTIVVSAQRGSSVVSTEQSVQKQTKSFDDMVDEELDQ